MAVVNVDFIIFNMMIMIIMILLFLLIYFRNYLCFKLILFFELLKGVKFYFVHLHFRVKLCILLIYLKTKKLKNNEKKLFMENLKLNLVFMIYI